MGKFGRKRVKGYFSRHPEQWQVVRAVLMLAMFLPYLLLSVIDAFVKAACDIRLDVAKYIDVYIYGRTTNFESIEQAAEFWDSYDVADYDDLTREAHFDVDLRKRTFLTPLSPSWRKR